MQYEVGVLILRVCRVCCFERVRRPGGVRPSPSPLREVTLVRAWAWLLVSRVYKGPWNGPYSLDNSPSVTVTFKIPRMLVSPTLGWYTCFRPRLPFVVITVAASTPVLHSL